ncbi:MAG: hypothetical protein ACRENA_04175, partial [Vulcanimicrobiaceae bacterium]
QLVASGLVRAGTPHEEVAAVWAGDDDWKMSRTLSVFERELLVDSGHAIARIANLLIYTSVLAALAINFPQWTIADALLCGLSLGPIAWSARRSLNDLISKRTRQQNLFGVLRESEDAKPEQYREATYWLQRDPSFGTWPALNRRARLVVLVRHLWTLSRWYWPREPYA